VIRSRKIHRHRNTPDFLAPLAPACVAQGQRSVALRASLLGLPTNQGFLRLFSTVKLRKYSSKPLTGFAWGWTDRVPSTSGSLPLLTNPLALQPSLPIHEKAPVALHRLTALMTPATSWSEPKMMQPTARNPRGMSSRGNEFSRKIIKRRHPSRSFSPPLSRLKPFPIIFIGFILGLTLRACSRHRRARIPPRKAFYY